MDSLIFLNLKNNTEYFSNRIFVYRTDKHNNLFKHNYLVSSHELVSR